MMSSKLKLAIAGTAFIFILLISYSNKEKPLSRFVLEPMPCQVKSDVSSQNLLNSQDFNRLKEMSEILKNRLQQLGQLSCEIAKDDTSINGGWCAKISGVGGGQHLTDDGLVSFLTKFLKGKILIIYFGDF